MKTRRFVLFCTILAAAAAPVFAAPLALNIGAPKIALDQATVTSYRLRHEAADDQRNAREPGRPTGLRR